MTAASGQAAVANGRKFTSYTPSGMCLQWVRSKCWQVGSYYGSAIEAWNGAKKKHPGDRNPPLGAPCFYKGGKYGHVVIYVGNGNVRSTDTPSSTKVGEVPLAWFESHWGYPYLGWTGDLNGVTLPLSAAGGGSSGSGSGGGDDDMQLSDPIDEWSPDDGKSKDKSTVGKTLNQARGYAEDAYDRIKALESKVDQILKAVTK